MSWFTVMIGILKESIWQFLNLNAVLGILGIFALGIFLAWYINATLLIPIPKDPLWASLGRHQGCLEEGLARA